MAESPAGGHPALHAAQCGRTVRATLAGSITNPVGYLSGAYHGLWLGGNGMLSLHELGTGGRPCRDSAPKVRGKINGEAVPASALVSQGARDRWLDARARPACG